MHILQVYHDFILTELELWGEMTEISDFTEVLQATRATLSDDGKEQSEWWSVLV